MVIKHFSLFPPFTRNSVLGLIGICIISVLYAVLRSIYTISKYFYCADTAHKVKCEGTELYIFSLDSQHNLNSLCLISCFSKEGDLILI